MPYVIPTSNDVSAYQFQITLDGEIYIFVFRWNTVHEYWTLDILDFASTPLAVGIKITINYPLTHRYASSLLPPGELIAIDGSGNLERIGREDLAEDSVVKLLYVTKQEYEDNVTNAAV